MHDVMQRPSILLGVIVTHAANRCRVMPGASRIISLIDLWVPMRSFDSL